MIVNTLASNLAIQVFTFGTSIMIARFLGPTGRGELALVLLYPQLVACIVFMGVDRAVAVLGGRGELNRPVATMIKLAILFSAPAMLVGYAIVIWRVADPHLAELAKMYLIYMPAMYFSLLAVSLFNGIGDFNRFNLTRLGFYIINFALVLAIWLASPKTLIFLDWVLLANLVAIYCALALAIWMLRGYNISVSSSAVAGRKGDVRMVIGLAVMFALPVGLTSFGASAYQIVLEQIMGVKALGLFVVFFSYSRLLSPISSAIGSHVFHFSISGENRDIDQIFRLSLVIYLGCALLLWVVAGWLVPMMFGRDFVVDNGTVGALLISMLFSLLANILAEYLTGQRKVAANTVGQILYLITLVILGMWLVPRFGLLGMALALAIGDMLRCGYLIKQVSCDTERSMKKFWQITMIDLFTLFYMLKRICQEFFLWRRKI